jgi:hypothetical protein
MEKTHGNAMFNVTLHTEDYGEEISGDCCWNVSVGDLRKIFARFPKLESWRSFPDSIGQACEDADVPVFENLADDDIVSFRDADAGIIMISAMADIGGVWNISWQGDNQMWFFHDWDHVLHDVEMHHDMPKIGTIYAENEQRALVNGAREALKAGISIDLVCEAIAPIGKQFEGRFAQKLENIWSDIFHGMMIVPK